MTLIRGRNWGKNAGDLSGSARVKKKVEVNVYASRCSSNTFILQQQSILPHMRLLRTSRRSGLHWRVSEPVRGMKCFDYSALGHFNRSILEIISFFFWEGSRWNYQSTIFDHWQPLSKGKKKEQRFAEKLQTRRNHVIAKMTVNPSPSLNQMQWYPTRMKFKFHWFVQLSWTNIRVRIGIIGSRVRLT